MGGLHGHDVELNAVLGGCVTLWVNANVWWEAAGIDGLLLINGLVMSCFFIFL